MSDAQGQQKRATSSSTLEAVRIELSKRMSLQPTIADLTTSDKRGALLHLETQPAKLHAIEYLQPARSI